MGVTLAQIASNTASVTITGGTLAKGQSLNVTYYPGRITETAVLAPTGLSNMTPETAPDKFKAFNEMLASLVQSWDLVGLDDQPFPVDPSRFPELPFAFRMQIYTAMMRDIRPETIAP
jgi:hypothetical protein